MFCSIACAESCIAFWLVVLVPTGKDIFLAEIAVRSAEDARLAKMHHLHAPAPAEPHQRAEPLSLVLTPYHILLLYPHYFLALNRLDYRIAFEKDLNDVRPPLPATSAECRRAVHA